MNKTLVITQLESGTTWMETDEAFAVIYAAEPEVIADVRELTPGKRLFFTVAGETPDGPRLELTVRRRYPPPGVRIGAADVVAPLLALAVFIAGLCMVPR